jgi:hypothetical protein
MAITMAVSKKLRAGKACMMFSSADRYAALVF